MTKATEGVFPYDRVAPNGWWPRNAAGHSSTFGPHYGESAKFHVDKTTALMSAGSCFAQRISRDLRNKRFGLLDGEPVPSGMSDGEATRRQYGVYSARYGNVYSARQMVQLVQRAAGQFVPREVVWKSTEGRFVDPFRPTVDLGGLSSVEAVVESRARHLAAVQSVISMAEIVIFTVGVTEIWMDKRDGSVFPICPGSAFGSFDPERFLWVNQSYADVVEDLRRLRRELRELNPNIKLILTVSPVPLMATLSGQNVTKATMYSKSVLRAAVEDVVSSYSDVEYFASYEMAASPHFEGRFESDGRTVRDSTVSQIMTEFYKFFCRDGLGVRNSYDVTTPYMGGSRGLELEPAVTSEDVCDEETVLGALSRASGRADFG